MLLRISIGLVVVAAVIMLIAYKSYSIGYENGHSRATIEAGVQLTRLKNVIAEVNQREQELIQQQRDSYRIALNVRNEQYQVIHSELTDKEQKIKELINEATDDCVTRPIPDSFK